MGEHKKFNIKSLSDLRFLAEELNLDIPLSENTDVLFESVSLENRVVPNRIVVQPMEGFDSLPNGAPGELTKRRYLRYAAGGSGMIWFEATSVMQEGRSNPGQLMLTSETLDEFRRLVDAIRKKAIETYGSSFNPFLVLQLTHSGRFSKPEGIPLRKYFSKNPFLDAWEKKGELINDEDIENIRDHYFKAIQLAEIAGFDSVDIKVSHGYLLHEIIASFSREGSRYGGSFDRRKVILNQLINSPGSLLRSIRLNACDMIPFPYGFGMRQDGSMIPDLSEVIALIELLADRVPLWNITAGIPYYNPHVNRPYDKGIEGSTLPPEHPLEGVARMIELTGELQINFPSLPMVGSAYSWLRHYFPFVGAGVIQRKLATFIGLGRMAFAYPDAPRDLMTKGYLDSKKVCVSCSGCTRLMRQGRATGCVIRDKDLYNSKL